jgi:hypothetical protein
MKRFVVKSGTLFADFTTNGDTVRPQVRDVSWMSGERGLQYASKFRTAALASYVGAQVQGVDGPPRVEEVEL